MLLSDLRAFAVKKSTSGVLKTDISNLSQHHKSYNLHYHYHLKFHLS